MDTIFAENVTIVSDRSEQYTFLQHTLTAAPQKALHIVS